VPPNGPLQPDELLARLEARIDRAAGAAEELIAQARRMAGPRPPEAAPPADEEPDAEELPPAGWQARTEPRGAGDLELLLQVLGSLRDRIPRELQRRLAEALRELLLAIRALIDWYLERADRRPREPAEVQDIPIL